MGATLEAKGREGGGGDARRCFFFGNQVSAFAADYRRVLREPLTKIHVLTCEVTRSFIIQAA